MWKALHHPNVLELIGVTMSETQFAMVSDWMLNGNINEFVKAHPGADRLELVGFLFEVILLQLKCIDNLTTCLAGRRHRGVDLHPQSGNDPWGS